VALGGMLGNNSCGTHSLMAGKTSDNVHERKLMPHDEHARRLVSRP
jgi:FAD/FMN-containing dehydrogenase